jgi:DNA-binding CsgD family transcriptional regulator
MSLADHLERVDELAASLNTHYEVFKYMKTITHDLGMKAFMVMTLPTVDIFEISEAKIITNWPAEMIDYYDANNLLIDSPVIRRMLGSTSPFNYDVEAINSGRPQDKQATVIALFKKHGLEKGAYFPVHDAAGRRGALSISGARTLDVQERACMLYIASRIYDRLSQITLKDRQKTAELTQVELDCLSLAAGGKKSGEIAELIKLSESTVNNHLTAIVKKLGCTTRTQAILTALRLNIIRS